MSESNLFIDTIFLIASAFILKEYFNSIFRYKDTSAIKHWFYWFLYVALQIVVEEFRPENMYTKIAMNIGFIIFIAIIAYAGKIHSKIMFSLLYMAVWMVSELVLNFIFPLLGAETSFVYGAVFSKLILFLFIRGISLVVTAKRYVDLPTKYHIVLFTIALCSIAVIATIYKVTQNMDDQDNSAAFLFISMVLMFMNFLIYIAYEKVVESFLVAKSNSLYAQQLQLCSEQVMEREEAMLDVRNIRHDMKNHLIYLREMTDIDEKDKLVDYLDKLIKDINLERIGISRSGNIVIDSLVNYKYSIACKESIDFQISITVPYRLPFDDGDICIILGNALDNAIEASLKLPPEERYIRLSIGAKKNAFSIVIKNRYNGIVKKDRNLKYVTCKKDSKNHGIGLISIDKAVSKYNGQLEIQDSENEFSLMILLYINEENAA